MSSSSATYPENRDKDLENLLGQFLVASFQSSKLSEMIRERFRGFGKDIRLILPGNPPLSVSVRIEPYSSPPISKQEEIPRGKSSKDFVTVVALAESPPLEVPEGNRQVISETQNAVEEAFAGLFRYWKEYRRQGADYLKLDEWRVKVSIITSADASTSTEEFITSMNALEAKRKGHIIGSP